MPTMENKQCRFYSCDPKLHTITIHLIFSSCQMKMEVNYLSFSSWYPNDVDRSCIITIV